MDFSIERTFYIRDNSNVTQATHKGLPIACVVLKQTEEANCLAMGVSFVHPEDRAKASKKVGRKKAQRRMKRVLTNQELSPGTEAKLTIPPGASFKDTQKLVAMHLLGCDGFHLRPAHKKAVESILDVA